ncbi:MAG: signal recognition particle-docking protein FtsY [Halanaerobiales bacterium]|nr:signal recognition particle-docking protein FtsY [Halanaerobiales bacterium]
MLKKIFGRKKENEEQHGLEAKEELHVDVKKEEETNPEIKPKVGFFQRLKEGLSKTRKGFIGQVENLFTGKAIDDNFFEELEEILIRADVGVKTTMRLVERLEEIVDERRLKEPSELREVFREEISNLLGDSSPLELYSGLNIIIMVGVNGAGKTTTIAKIAERFKKQNKKILLAAGDTFRAAAVDQLKVWGNRVGIDVIAHSEGADPGAVAFDAVQAARSRNVDLLVVDTAGRLHTQKNLMEELKKVRRVIGKEAGDAHVQVLLVVDATTGQNAINQARIFNEAVQVDGIVLTKLDGTAKGGIVIAIKDDLNIPIKLIGVGEKAEDLQDFQPEEFVKALFAEE